MATLKTRVKALEQQAPEPDVCGCPGAFQVLTVNEWRDLPPQERETCPVCGKRLPVIHLEWVEDWRALDGPRKGGD